MTFVGLEGIPEVRSGEDLAPLIAEAMERIGFRPRPGDALVVCQKVVSKSEGQIVPLESLRPARIARAWGLANHRDPREVQAVLAEARAVIRAERGVLITETHHGFVCANSGVDRSNVPHGTISLLPKDPDGSAARLARRLTETTGAGIPVVISDSWGRPFRLGAVAVAIGIAGLPAILDLRGEADAGGRTLRSSLLAVGDEIAAAASLLMGKLRRIPAVVIRGLPEETRTGDGSGAALLRDRGEDLFR